MVRSDELAKIVDFGLAKLNPAIASATASDSAPTLARTGMSDPGGVMGTVGYMSPEQATLTRSITGRTARAGDIRPSECSP